MTLGRAGPCPRAGVAVDGKPHRAVARVASSRRDLVPPEAALRATWPVETKTVAGTPALVSMGSARRMVSA